MKEVCDSIRDVRVPCSEERLVVFFLKSDDGYLCFFLCAIDARWFTVLELASESQKKVFALLLEAKELDGPHRFHVHDDPAIEKHKDKKAE